MAHIGISFSRATCVLGVLLWLQPLAAAQTFDVEGVRVAKRVTANRISEPIVIDGVFDEAAWSAAEPTGDFFQQNPQEFSPATERTEARFLYDDEMDAAIPWGKSRMEAAKALLAAPRDRE